MERRVGEKETEGTVWEQWKEVDTREGEESMEEEGDDEDEDGDGDGDGDVGFNEEKEKEEEEEEEEEGSKLMDFDVVGKLPD